MTSPIAEEADPEFGDVRALLDPSGGHEQLPNALVHRLEAFIAGKIELAVETLSVDDEKDAHGVSRRSGEVVVIAGTAVIHAIAKGMPQDYESDNADPASVSVKVWARSALISLELVQPVMADGRWESEHRTGQESQVLLTYANSETLTLPLAGQVSGPDVVAIAKLFAGDLPA